MAPVRYRLDSTWRRPGTGEVVLAGSPMRLFRLSAGGAHVIARVEAGDPPTTAAVTQLLDRFVEAGALHPEYEPGDSPFTAGDVTVVCPAYGRLPGAVPDVAQVIVVDDASPAPLRDGGRTVLRHDDNRGPAAARNTGLAAVTTPLVAFVDTDVDLPEGWLGPLLAQFADERVALVAPRVASADDGSAMSRYETRHSPLDLGDEPARIAPGTRVSYVPAAVIVCRTEAVRALGGFDESLRFGEDVDLVWRLLEAGHRARYEPSVVVRHRPRRARRALWRQRFGYGSSAAPLAARHPGALAPVRMSGWSLAVWGLVAARRPLTGVVLAATTSALLVRTLKGVPPAESARLASLGHLAAGRQLAVAARRVWWPLLLAAFVARPTRPAAVAAVLAVPLIDAVRTRSWQPLADAPDALADDVAYGAGVWKGVIAAREPGPLLPSLSGWPRRGDR